MDSVARERIRDNDFIGLRFNEILVLKELQLDWEALSGLSIDKFWLSKVVFPEPKNPDRTVTGSLEAAFMR